MMAAAPAGGGGGEAAAAAPTEFNVMLEPGFDAAKKVNIIKIVRELTGWSLMDCKATVEGAPKAVKENADKKTADDLKKKLEDAARRSA